ncbi:DNA glycosylase AlkZ-like family protein [Nocardioides bigeumensis]|uniref:Winged helix DNA-binding domain-containing protein n=1 Tax=Nocardioides bigeumensis TaxID=433657 RepID=A0ABN2Y3H6_9ACTN
MPKQTTGPLVLSARDARRVAFRAQLLADDRPSDLLALARHLTVLQYDVTRHVAPSADLVAWSRLGSEFRPGDLEDAVAAGSLIELDMMLRPAEDLALFTAEMAVWPGPGPLKDWQRSLRDWVEANDHSRRDILDKLHDEGPLPTSAFPDTTAVPWESSGWNNDRSVRMLVSQMVSRGEVAAAGRDGRDRLWDLAERVYPDVPPVPLDEALEIRARRRLRSLGLARARAARMPGEPNDVGVAGVEAVVDGVRGKWRVDPAYLDGLDDAFDRPCAVLLSPLDRLVFDRKRMDELLDFDYQLEMYKPKAKRRWGYWAMPIAHGDRLVGKLDAKADRDSGVLEVGAIHEDGRWSAAMREAVDEQVAALADWLGLVEERGPV